MSWQDDTRVCAGLYRKRGNAEDSLYSSDIGSHINTLTTVLYCIKEWANIDLTLPIHHHYTVHVQKRATKLIHGFEKFSYSDRLRKSELPTLKYRRIRGDMIETYKIITGIYDKEASPVLKLNLSTITRGN